MASSNFYACDQYMFRWNSPEDFGAQQFSFHNNILISAFFLESVEKTRVQQQNNLPAYEEYILCWTIQEEFHSAYDRYMLRWISQENFDA